MAIFGPKTLAAPGLQHLQHPTELLVVLLQLLTSTARENPRGFLAQTDRF